ncbi:MAG: hypothetical protein DPW09_44865, partial [Anaerolineae bacterium]|nr:hypothetical protein [Anaerolineae bacterium]
MQLGHSTGRLLDTLGTLTDMGLPAFLVSHLAPDVPLRNLTRLHQDQVYTLSIAEVIFLQLLKARVGLNTFVAVYTDLTVSQEAARLPSGTELYLCAKAGDFYLVAQNYCHLADTKPLGWIRERNLELMFEGQFPPALITPVPPTSTPLPTNTPTSAPPTNTPLPQTITASDGASMVLVPAGPFEMGSDQGDSGEQPAHEVTLTAFYIDLYEVMNAQYRQCVEAGECEQPGCPIYYENEAKRNHPVVCVNWDQAQKYCEWREGRLPTEAEWEKAARG